MTRPQDLLIAIDAGHAERTPGKRAGSNPTFFEYEGNRRTSRMLDRKLKAAGFRTMFTCNLDDPNDMPLHERARNAVNAGANVLVSVHTNAINNTSVRGTETFIHTGSTASLPIARSVQRKMLEHIGQRDRGVKRANFGILRNSYKHMLAILTEADFFTNPTARNWMFQSSFDDAYSQAIIEGIADHYGIELKEKKEPVAPGNSNQNNPPSEDVGAPIVRVLVNRMNVRNKLSWSNDAIDHQVQRGEAFTVMSEHEVGNGSMYKLKSGLYISTHPDYVELDGRIQDTTQESSSGETSGGQRAPIRPYPGSPLRLTSPFMRDRNNQSDIQAVQRAVRANPDGVFGPATKRAVQSYQSRHNLTADGIVGPKTWNVMF